MAVSIITLLSTPLRTKNELPVKLQVGPRPETLGESL